MTILSGSATMDKKEKTAFTEDVDPVPNTKQGEEPVSYFFIVLFYFLGTACFMPNNFYVTSNEYWMYKFRDPSRPFNKSDTSEKTNLQKNFTAYNGISSNMGMLLALVLTVLLISKIPLQARIVGSISALLTLFGITLLFIFLDTDSWQGTFFVIALGIGSLLRLSSTVLLISLYQLATRISMRCLAAQNAGMSVCGIFAALGQILSLLAATSVQGTACLYYSMATAALVAVLIVYLISSYKSTSLKRVLEHKPKSSTNVFSLFKPDKLLRVAKKIALLIASLVLADSATQILQPGVTSLIESSGKGTNTWSDSYFLPVSVFLSYNVFEFIGREGCNHIQLLRNQYIIFATAVMRLSLFPLLLLCNLQPRNNLPVVFHDDAYFIIFVILLACTNGYVQNIAIVVIPELCNPDEKTTGMLIIVLVMIVFVALFAVLGGVLVNVI